MGGLGERNIYMFHCSWEHEWKRCSGEKREEMKEGEKS